MTEATRRDRRLLGLGAALAVTASAGALLPLDGWGAEPAKAQGATLEDLAWLAGHWVDTEGGDLSEEIWTAPSGDSIVGIWRWVKGRNLKVVEILSIRVEEGRPVLRLRHFDQRLVAREERGSPLAWPLVRSGPREAVFEGLDTTGRKVRLTYQRPDDSTLEAVLEKGGKPQRFRYQRR
jgi:hypothetical protein